MNIRIRNLLLSIVMAATTSVALALPPGYTDTLVGSVPNPTSIAFTPDGRILVAQQTGKLHIIQNGDVLPTPALTFADSQICIENERGLLGVAVDPDFSSNGYVYLYYTFKKFPGPSPCSVLQSTDPVNRVSRFTMTNSTINPASEVVLVDNMGSPNGNHNGGHLLFGPDGYLYISVGDGGCNLDPFGCSGENTTSRFRNRLNGKILRIAKDGSIPADNPFQGQGTARCNTGPAAPGIVCQETYAWGLRNPFRFAFDPNDANHRLFINDVGQDVREEINLGQSGGDYGWNCMEGTRVNYTQGPCNPTPANMIAPIFEYSHTEAVPGTTETGCSSIVGGAFVPNGLWPGYDGKYFFADYSCGAIFTVPATGTLTATTFSSGLGSFSAVDMRFGPDGGSQALYYTTYANGGQVRKITYTSTGNQAPTAAISATALSGPVPFNASFSGANSSDPNAGDTLTYFWTFGDGTPETSTTTPTTSHTYTTPGVYTVSLRVRDQNLAFSTPVTLRVYPGNTAPTPVITFPGASDKFTVGQNVTLTGTATDVEDGTLPGSSLTWNVLLHHNEHTHPVLTDRTGSSVNLTTPAPEGIAPASTSYLEVILKATDAAGQSATVTRDYLPLTSTVTLNTNPAGRTIDVNATTQTGPASFVSWVGYGLNVSIPTQTTAPGERFTFQNWSDGGAASHTIVTPAGNPTYTANFLTEYLLSTAVSPAGSGSVSYSGGPWFTSGTQVTLQANAAACSAFSSWSANAPNGIVTLDAAKTVTANFVSDAATNVSGQLAFSGAGFSYDRLTGRYRQIVTIQNNGAALSNVSMVFGGLTPGVVVYQANGMTQCSQPSGLVYLNLGAIGSGQTIKPMLEFTKSTSATIFYQPLFVAGNGAR